MVLKNLDLSITPPQSAAVKPAGIPFSARILSKGMQGCLVERALGLCQENWVPFSTVLLEILEHIISSTPCFSFPLFAKWETSLFVTFFELC